MEEISQLRRKIDEIDEEILRLLKERIEISRLIGRIKQEHGVPIRDPQREEEKYKHIAMKATELGLNLDEVRTIYQNIITMSVRAQERSGK